MLFVFSEVQVREAIEQIKCLVPLTKHGAKIQKILHIILLFKKKNKNLA